MEPFNLQLRPVWLPTASMRTAPFCSTTSGPMSLEVVFWSGAPFSLPKWLRTRTCSVRQLNLVTVTESPERLPAILFPHSTDTQDPNFLVNATEQRSDDTNKSNFASYLPRCSLLLRSAAKLMFALEQCRFLAWNLKGLLGQHRFRFW